MRTEEGGDAMQVQLTFTELRALRKMLIAELSELRTQVHHSRGTEFKWNLRRREAGIRTLIDKLDREERRVLTGVDEATNRYVIGG